jgi:hypothetical protein
MRLVAGGSRLCDQIFLGNLCYLPGDLILSLPNDSRVLDYGPYFMKILAVWYPLPVQTKNPGVNVVSW